MEPARPGHRVAPGLAILVTVDPDDDALESDETDNTFPASGTPLAADVRELPPFRVRFVPVHVPALGATVDVDAANADDYMATAAAMFPIAGYDADVRAAFTRAGLAFAGTTIPSRSAWSVMRRPARSSRSHVTAKPSSHRPTRARSTSSSRTA